MFINMILTKQNQLDMEVISYRASKTKQGVYLYVGYDFVKYLGVSCFTKKNHPDSVISAHDSYESLYYTGK